jgi:hypothetical protein
MLGKLFASEIKQTYKPMVTVTAILVLSTLLSNLETSIMRWAGVSSDNIIGIIINTLMGLIFTGSVFAVVIVGFVFLISCFYKSMYSERGYLTHTLPTGSNMTFSVKYIVAVLWMAVAAVIIGTCCLFRAVNMTEETFGEFFGRIGNIMDIWQPALRGLVFVGNSTAGTVVRFAGLAFFGIMSSFLFFFTAITLGQLSNEHKVGCAVGAGVVLYMIQQVLGFVAMIVVMAGQMGNVPDLAGGIDVINRAVLTGLIIIFVLMAAEYAVDMYIVKKHLNLQ